MHYDLLINQSHLSGNFDPTGERAGLGKSVLMAFVLPCSTIRHAAQFYSRFHHYPSLTILTRPTFNSPTSLRHFHFKPRRRTLQPQSSISQQQQQQQTKKDARTRLGNENNTTESKKEPKKPRGDKLIIVGLGNPGGQYAQTRHNIGFMMLDTFASRNNIRFRPETKFRAHVADGMINSRQVYLVKPMTYMNESGECVKRLMKYYGVGRDGVMVVVDDMMLEVGKVRLREKGSAGGHNGLKSVEKCLGGKVYCRLRVGVGEPGGGGESWTGHVLGNFGKRELKVLEEVAWDVGEVLEEWIREENLNMARNVLSRRQNKC